MLICLQQSDLDHIQKFDLNNENVSFATFDVKRRQNTLFEQKGFHHGKSGIHCIRRMRSAIRMIGMQVRVLAEVLQIKSGKIHFQKTLVMRDA